MIPEVETLRDCYELAAKSPDPHTQTAAAVMWDQMVIGAAYNRIPKKIDATPQHWDRHTKQRYVVHAEQGAILEALPTGLPLDRCTLIAPWFACVDCARMIVAVGIPRVVGHAPLRRFAEVATPSWTSSVTEGWNLLAEAGVEMEWWEGPLMAYPVRVGGLVFDPSRDQLAA